MGRVTRCSGSDLSGGVRGCARVLALCPGRSLALDRVPSRAFLRPPPEPCRVPGLSRPFRFPPPRVRPPDSRSQKGKEVRTGARAAD